MTIPPYRILIFLFVSLSFATAQEGPEQDPLVPLTVEQKLFGFSNFWREVTYNFGHWDTAPGLDWDQAYQTFLPRIMASGNNFEYYREMQRFCALLKDGHTNVYVPESLLQAHLGSMPLQLEDVDHHVIVTNVAQSLADRIPLGSEILKLDGRPVQEIVEQEIIPLISTSAPHMYWDNAVRSPRVHGVGLLLGTKNKQVVLTVAAADDQQGEVTVEYRPFEEEVEWVREPETRPLSEFKLLQDGIAYMALNYFSRDEIVPAFEEHLPELYKAKGIILDLRKNGGGKSNIAAKILDYFTDSPYMGAAWRTPKHVAAYKAWGKFVDEFPSMAEYRDYYFGHVYLREDPKVNTPPPGEKLKVPTMVLIGRRTASASEDFLVMADNIPHMTYVGEPTFGSTGQPLFLNLPGGGRARISTKRDFYPDGREFIGVGILPDVTVKASVADVRAGRDPVLEKALALLIEQ